VLILLLKLAAAATSIALAAGIFGRDPGLRSHRLIAAFLVCNAWWASGEFFLLQQHDSEAALRIARVMTLGWIPLGVLCMHASLALLSMDDHPVARLLPAFYVAVGCLLPFSLGTGFVVAEVEPTVWGWKPRFDVGFAAAYGLLVAPLLTVLWGWRKHLTRSGEAGRRRLARIVLCGLAIALVMGTLTAVVLPWLGIDSIPLTTSLVAVVGIAVAVGLRRYGSSLISPEAFAREILGTLEDGVILLGERELLRDANPAFLQLIRRGEADAIGRPIGHWISDFPAPTDGEAFPAMLQLRPEGGPAVPIVVSAPIACHDAGRPIGNAFLVRDRREVDSLRRQLILSARLAAVGDLSKAISDSIHEPVAKTRGELEGLGRDWRALTESLGEQPQATARREILEEGGELIDECMEGLDRISSIVGEVGRFSSETVRPEMSVCSLAEILDRALRVARVHAPPDVEIEIQLEADSEIRCSRAEIERVVTNLLVNALYALRDKEDGVPHLAVAIAHRGENIVLHVEDDGCGIDEDFLDRVFDPFFTTKPVGEGTGLGLAISYHIVTSHGGEIRVSSVAGRGTSVTVELPRHREAV